MTRLYEIHHDFPGRLWCGPAAIAAVTGAPTSRAVSAIKAVRDKYGDFVGPVKGTWPNEIARAIGRIRPTWSIEVIHFEYFKTTLAQWRNYHRQSNLIYVVAITGHFLAVAGNKLMDDNNREWIPVSEYHKQRAIVRKVIQIRRRRPTNQHRKGP